VAAWLGGGRVDGKFDGTGKEGKERGRLFATSPPTSTMIAMKPRGKIVAFSTAAVGLVVLAGVAVARKESILERWYLWRLESEELEDRVHAAEKLGELGSAKAVPLLIRSVARWGDLSIIEKSIPKMGNMGLKPVIRVLDETPWEQRSGVMEAVVRLRLDEAAMPTLIESSKHRNLHVRWVTAMLLGDLGAAAKNAVGPLQEALTDSDPDVAKCAKDALEKIQLR
jgi:hypothetical protein